MRAVVLLAVVVAIANAASLQSAVRSTLYLAAEKNFNVWKIVHKKTYASAEEEAARKLVWDSNLAYITKFNSENHEYTLGMNEFSDMSPAEFKKLYLSGLMEHRNSTAPIFEAPAGFTAPDSVDWRTKGYVTPIKNQGQCGSCWSFSATGSFEGAHFKATGKLVSFSEQNLVDCSTKQGNEGCNGGLMDYAFTYIISNKGLDTEASYPYTARDGTCKYNAANSGGTLSKYTDVKSGSETDLQNAVGSVGPVSVAIDASHDSFQFYKSGVYNELTCSAKQLDHGVLAVGYGTLTGKDYWLVKNSWGTSWGQQGYILMSRNKRNQCGIATAASYPTV